MRKWHQQNNKNEGAKWLKLGSARAKFLPTGIKQLAGQEVQMSNNAVYLIMPDGSVRRVKNEVHRN